MKISTENHEDTLAFGERLGRCLEPGDIVFLLGDLGAGKTTLTQGLCRGLGLDKEEYISSPTFTLVNSYQGTIPINHIDLYRLNSFSEVEALGLEESLFSNCVSIIEWAEKLFPKIDTGLPGLGIEERIEIRIALGQKNLRTFDIKVLNQKSRILSL